MKIGVIGTGNIARFLLEETRKDERFRHLKIVSLFGRNKEKGSELSEAYQVEYYHEMEDFLNSPVDVIVEAAAVQVAREHSKAVLYAGKDLVLSSVGALADQTFYKQLEEIATEKKQRVYVPSGAIGGIDLIKGANMLGQLKSVSLISKKPPNSFGINEQLTEEKVIFEGSASEAIEKFPKNINVSIVLSLAGVGVVNTAVSIVADPQVTKNTHIIRASGEFGNFDFIVENEPMPNNPKTSYLAALSILSILQNKNKPIQIGS